MLLIISTPRYFLCPHLIRCMLFLSFIIKKLLRDNVKHKILLNKKKYIRIGLNKWREGKESRKTTISRYRHRNPLVPLFKNPIKTQKGNHNMYTKNLCVCVWSHMGAGVCSVMERERKEKLIKILKRYY